MDDKKKIAIIKASLINIGRSLPDGMKVTFERGKAFNSMATMEMVYPDGTVTNIVFTSVSPLFDVPVIPETFSLTEEQIMRAGLPQ